MKCTITLEDYEDGNVKTELEAVEGDMFPPEGEEPTAAQFLLAAALKGMEQVGTVTHEEEEKEERPLGNETIH